MKKVKFRGSIIETPNPELTISDLKKKEYQGIGKKKRLTVLKNEVFVSQNVSSAQKPKNMGQRASLFMVMNKNKNKSSSVGKTPLASLKGEAAVFKGKNYEIVNPVERERSLSQTKRVRQQNKILLSNRQNEDHYECSDNSKRGTVEIYKVNMMRIPKKVKDENYFATVIQDQYRKYREIKLEKEYAKIRNCRRFFNAMNTFYKNYNTNLKKNLFYRMTNMKPKEIEVTAQEYYLIQHLKEMGINSVMDFRRAVAAIVNSNN